MTYRGQLRRVPAPAEPSVSILVQVRCLIGRRREAAQPGKVSGRRAVTAGPAKEEPVEELASLDRGRLFKWPRVAFGTGGDDAAPLAPQAQVVDGAQGVAGVRVASLFSRVDEVEGYMSRNERDLGDCLHSVILPAKSVLPV